MKNYQETTWKDYIGACFGVLALACMLHLIGGGLRALTAPSAEELQAQADAQAQLVAQITAHCDAEYTVQDIRNWCVQGELKARAKSK